MPSPILIQPDSNDVEALARLVYAEAANIEADYSSYFQTQGDSPTVAAEKAEKLAYGSIIDSILNRVAADSAQYGTTIQDVIDKHTGGTYQYSSLPDNGATTWSQLPDVSTSINDFVESHLAARANGEGSVVGGATHYYNPNISSPTWGDDLQRSTNVGLDTDQHVFGLLPGSDPIPTPYTIDFGGHSTTTSEPVPVIPGHKPESFGPPEPFGPPDPVGPYVPNVTGPFGQSEGAVSPLVLDIDHSGTIELAALNGTGSVYWDIDQDGFREASGWITGGDGLLCVDLNSDGIINDHGELFGGTNGYSTLAAYDTNSSNTITSADTHFGDLLVWIDDNANGYSESTELHTLNSLGITSITTSFSNVNYDIAGNHIAHQSTFVMNGNTDISVDAFFTYDPTNTIYSEDYVLDARTVFLPMLRGYGDLPDLHVAMSLDEDLLDLVQDFSEKDTTDLFASALAPDGDIQDIMFRWAGVDGVNPTSRGANIDARILGFLEAFVGQDFVQSGFSSDPLGPPAGTFLMQAWNNAYEAIATRLIYQALGAQNLFVGDAHYDPVTDSFHVPTGINFTAVEAWISADPDWMDQVNPARYVVKIIDQVLGVTGLSSPDYDDLQDLLPVGSTLEQFMHSVAGTGTISGTSDDNLLIGSNGTDTLNGNGGNDLLIGGSGNDDLRGGTGNDTYVFAAGSGTDSITENASAGTDVLQLTGYEAGDVRLWSTTSGTLHVTNLANSSDDITIAIGITGASGTTGELGVNNVEQITFDSTTLSLTGGLPIEGTSSGENLYGTQYADTISGLGGADTLYGNRGDDTLIGGSGNDDLRGGAGNDTYVFASGFGTDSITENASAGTDVLQLTGYEAGDVRIWSTSSGTLHISSLANSSDDITVAIGITGSSGTTGELGVNNVEQVTFDSTTLSLTGGLPIEGTSSGENLYGTQYADHISGLGGADTLYGNRGDDTLTGGSGNDDLRGGAGNDTYIFASGFGTDSITENASAGTDVLQLTGYEAGDVRIWSNTSGTLHITSHANSSDDITITIGVTGASGTTGELGVNNVEQITFDSTTLSLTGGLPIEGTSSGENLYGTQYADHISGLDGADTLYGNRGDDMLIGGNGNDDLRGGDGNDLLYGGAGSDHLNGGAGADTFVFEAASTFSASDTIDDFNVGQADKIDLHDVLDVAFDPVTNAISDFVHFTNSGSNSVMSIDQDGTGSSYGFVNVATFTGILNLDETTLHNNGNLLVA